MKLVGQSQPSRCCRIDFPFSRLPLIRRLIDRRSPRLPQHRRLVERRDGRRCHGIPAGRPPSGRRSRLAISLVTRPSGSPQEVHRGGEHLSGRPRRPRTRADGGSSSRSHRNGHLGGRAASGTPRLARGDSRRSPACRLSVTALPPAGQQHARAAPHGLRDRLVCRVADRAVAGPHGIFARERRVLELERSAHERHQSGHAVARVLGQQVRTTLMERSRPTTAAASMTARSCGVAVQPRGGQGGIDRGDRHVREFVHCRHPPCRDQQAVVHDRRTSPRGTAGFLSALPTISVASRGRRSDEPSRFATVSARVSVKRRGRRCLGVRHAAAPRRPDIEQFGRAMQSESASRADESGEVLDEVGGRWARPIRCHLDTAQRPLARNHFEERRTAERFLDGHGPGRGDQGRRGCEERAMLIALDHRADCVPDGARPFRSSARGLLIASTTGSR